MTGHMGQLLFDILGENGHVQPCRASGRIPTPHFPFHHIFKATLDSEDILLQKHTLATRNDPLEAVLPLEDTLHIHGNMRS